MKLPAALRDERVVAACLLLLFALAAAAALRADSSVADEHPHILSGYLYWQSGRFSGGIDNPPLGQLLVAAPLVVARVPYFFPADDALWRCRLPVLLGALGLGFLLWRWGRGMAGPAVGLWALTGFCLTPDLLAHGHVATVDLPLTLGWWAALWFWRAWLRAGATWRAWPSVLGFALAFAAATLTKFSAIVLLPSVWLVALLATRDLRQWRNATLAIGGALVVLWMVSWPAYGFGPGWNGIPAQLHAALAGKLAHRDEVQFAYLAGNRSENGFLAYYAVALLLKTPLLLLGFAALGAAALWRRRARADFLLLVVPAVAIVTAFSLVRVNIGVRHVLPAVPALVLLAGVGLGAMGGHGWAGQVVRAALVVLWGAGVARVHPQYLAYINRAAGGPAGGARWLLDSNLAWGQDDSRLSAFLRAAERRGESWAVNPDPELPRTGNLAVDVNTLHDFQRRSDRPHAWLRQFRPTEFASWSWPLFRLEAEDYARVARDHPQDPVAQAAYAEILWQCGAGAQARQLLEPAAARMQGVSLAELARLAARGAARRAEWAEAVRWARRGLEAAPLDLELAGLVRWFELELSLQRAASAGEQAVSRAALELGLYRAESGLVREALPALRHAASMGDDSGAAQRAYAVALARLGDYEAALALFEQPARAEWGEERDLVRALAATQAGLAANRPDLELRWVREFGRAQFEAERYDDALGAFLELLRRRPEDAEALAYAGEMQVRSKLRLVEARLQPRLVRVQPGGDPR